MRPAAWAWAWLTSSPAGRRPRAGHCTLRARTSTLASRSCPRRLSRDGREGPARRCVRSSGHGSGHSAAGAAGDAGAGGEGDRFSGFQPPPPPPFHPCTVGVHGWMDGLPPLRTPGSLRASVSPSGSGERECFMPRRLTKRPLPASRSLPHSGRDRHPPEFPGGPTAGRSPCRDAALSGHVQGPVRRTLCLRVRSSGSGQRTVLHGSTGGVSDLPRQAGEVAVTSHCP